MDAPLFPETELGPLRLHAGAPPLIMAVINASPESFHAGSVAAGAPAVAEAAARAQDAGADVLDIGAMSTAPYKEARISEAQEADRMGEAVTAARAACDLPISADTQRSAVARVALAAGATILNDVSALTADPALGALAAENNAGVILMAAGGQLAGRPAPDPVEAAAMLLREALVRAHAAGIREDRVVLDPGLGFFRDAGRPWFEFDLALLQGLGRLHELGRPLLVGASRKSFLGEVLGRRETADRLAGSLAAAAWCAARGVAIIRVHDVAETRDVVRLWRMMEGRGQAAS